MVNSNSFASCDTVQFSGTTAETMLAHGVLEPRPKVYNCMSVCIFHTTCNCFSTLLCCWLVRSPVNLVPMIIHVVDVCSSTKLLTMETSFSTHYTPGLAGCA